MPVSHLPVSDQRASEHPISDQRGATSPGAHPHVIDQRASDLLARTDNRGPRDPLSSVIAAGFPVASIDSPPLRSEQLRQVPLQELSRPGGIGDLVLRYADRLGSPRLAPAAAMATQKYAWPVASYVIGVWAFTGTVVSLDAPDIIAEVDDTGATVGLLVPDRPTGTPGTGVDAVREVVAHISGAVDTARRVGSASASRVWGGVAASIARAFVRALKYVEDDRRSSVLAQAHEALTPEAWPTGTQLVTLAPDGARYRRHTCCHVYTAAGQKECCMCPRRRKARP